MLRLFLLFTLVPALELYLLFQIGSVVGPGTTVLIILATGMVGSWLAKREGLSVVAQLIQELETGMPPANRLMEGGLILAGGLLLITPGVLTDVAGFSLIFPVTRRAIAPVVLAWAKRRITVRTLDPGGSPQPDHWKARPHDEAASQLPFDHPVK
ncbi:MAG: FxsA family protein [Proteobacteria bacterium]|nr:FxsA family protein [Pseudomonadota bacterium]